VRVLVVNDHLATTRTRSSAESSPRRCRSRQRTARSQPWLCQYDPAMTASTGRQLTERFVGAINAWDTAALTETLAPGFVDHTPVGDERGRGGFVGKKLPALHAAFADSCSALRTWSRKKAASRVVGP
jgi:hypothetical protein